MSLESVNRLAELTGRDRATVARRLAGLVATPGPKNAQLYESRDALPLLVEPATAGADRLSLEQERAALARAQREKTELAIAREQGQLIPIELASRLIGTAFAEVRAGLMSQHNTIAAEFPDLPAATVRRIQDANRELLERLASTPFPAGILE